MFEEEIPIGCRDAEDRRLVCFVRVKQSDLWVAARAKEVVRGDQVSERRLREDSVALERSRAR